MFSYARMASGLCHSSRRTFCAPKFAESDIFTFCKQGDVEAVRKLLTQSNIDVNEGYSRNGINLIPPLHISTELGHLSIVKELVKHPSIDVNKRKRSQQEEHPSLFAACEKGYLDIVRVLLSHPTIDVNNRAGLYGKIYFNHQTPLYISCEKGYQDIVVELLGHPNIDPNWGVRYSLDETPLSAACRKGYLDIVKLLLNNPSTDVNKGRQISPFLFGKTNSPLYVASENGQLDIVEELLCHASIDVNKSHEKPLLVACQKGYFFIVEKLLQSTHLPKEEHKNILNAIFAESSDEERENRMKIAAAVCRKYRIHPDILSNEFKSEKAALLKILSFKAESP